MKYGKLVVMMILMTGISAKIYRNLLVLIYHKNSQQ
jgi:hypothetical protein